MLNLIWISFFIIAFVTACFQAVFFGQLDIFATMVRAMFDSSKIAFEISLGLTGVMTFWLGIMKIGESAGFMAALARFLNPLFARIFPTIPANHPALGAITMNIAANMLGLDNAATPMGLKAMQELQTLNPEKDTASNAQILFLVINTASVTLFPVTIFAYRAQLGAADPTDVFIPILIATYISTLCGFIAVALVQKINLFDRVILSYMIGLSALMGGLTLWFAHLSAAQMQMQSSLISNFLLFLLVVVFICGAALKKINVYDAFIDDAKEGFVTAVRIIPYLVAMLVGIAVFRASGALELLMNAIRLVIASIGWV